jgi:hypothetical protein
VFFCNRGLFLDAMVSIARKLLLFEISGGLFLRVLPPSLLPYYTRVNDPPTLVCSPSSPILGRGRASLFKP